MEKNKNNKNDVQKIVQDMDAGTIKDILNPESMLMLEGGNMFPDVSRINQENVAPTLKYIYDNILPAIGIDRKYVQPLGSVGKRLPGGSSGDIDLGIDCTKVDYLKDAMTTDEQAKALSEYAKPILDKMGIQSVKKGNLYSIRCPIENFDGKQKNEFVQLDMMTSRNMKFQVWSQYAPKEIEGQQYIKGCIRNLIFEAAAHAMDDIKVIKKGLVKFKDGIREDAIEWEEYSFYTPEGLNIKRVTRDLAKNKKLAEQGVHVSGEKSTRSLVSDDPDVIAKKMFGPKVKGKDLMTWDGAWEAAHKAEWAKDEKKWKMFLDSLREKIQVKIQDGMTIPKEMLDELGIEQANENTQIDEGGHRFGNVVKIHQRNAKATMDNLMRDVQKWFGFTDDDCKFVGSAGKKLDSGSSGDIDIIVSRKSLEEKFGITTSDEWCDLLEEFCNDMGFDVYATKKWGWTGTSIAYPIANTDGEQEGELVQVDIVPSLNINFQSWSQYAPQEIEGEKFVKTLVRNEIMEAVAAITQEVLERGKVNGVVGDQNPIKWQKYEYDQDRDGLWKKIYTRQPINKKDGIHKKTADMTEEFVTSDPDEICQILFGINDSSKILNWKDAFEAAKKTGKLDSSQENLEKFKTHLSSGLKKAIRRGNLKYMPPELEDFLGFKLDSVPLSKGLKTESFNNESSDIDTPRTAMTKIHQLTGGKLKKFLNDFAEGINRDASIVIKATPKIDGQAYRIAWLNGEVMMELSNTGLLDIEGVESHPRLKPHEKNFYEYNRKHNAQKVQDFISERGLDGIKVIGEILPNGEGLADDNGTITYVGTSYDVSKLGKEGTMVMFSVKGLNQDKVYDIGDKLKEAEILDFLASDEISDKNVQFLDIEKFAQKIELSASDFPKDVIEQLKKTPPDDMKKQQKEEIRDQIDSAMMDIMKRKFKNPDIMPENDKSLEGVAFELNGVLYGIHFDEWKEYKHKYTDEMHEMDILIKRFLAQITDGNENSTVSKLMNVIRQNPDAYQEKYRELLPKFMDRSQELILSSETRTDVPRFIGNLAKSKADNLKSKFNPDLLTSDVMSFVELIDGKQVDQGGKTIALVPGSFRPPHKGHFEMVKHYARISDQVMVGISGQGNLASKRFDKFGRSMPGSVALQIMNKYVEAANLENVDVSVVENPINWISATLRHISNCKVILGLSKKDDMSRFERFTDKKFKATMKDVEILPLEEYAFDPEQENGENISATYVRQNIDDKEVLRKVLPSELDDRQFQDVYELMNPEGGKYNMVNEGNLLDFGNGVEVSRMNQENAQATFDDLCKRFLPEFGLKKDDVFPVGSMGKKLLPGKSIGDIDLAVDQNLLKKNLGIETPEEFSDKCQEIADKLGIKTIIKPKQGFSGVSFCWPIANVDGKQEGQFVQVDFVVSDNLKFTKWSYHQDDEEEVKDGELDQDVNPKGVVKDVLLRSIAGGGHLHVTKTGLVQGKEEPVELWKYAYDYRRGLYKVTKTRNPKKNSPNEYSKSWNKNQMEFVTSDPDEIAKILLDDENITADEVNSPKKLWNRLIQTDMWKNDETRHEIGRCFDSFVEQLGVKAPSFFKFDESNIIKEGGHAKSDCPDELKARINQENVDATLKDIYKRLLPKLGLKENDVEPVGSTGKKLPGGTSGDIDLAMPQDKVMKGTGTETPEEFIDYCHDIFEELDVYDATANGYGWKSVSCFWPIANTDGKQEGKYVQLDFVVTPNMKFISWGLHTDQEVPVKDGENPEDINPKTAVKLILIRSIGMGGHRDILETADIEGEGEDVPVKMKRYDFKFNEGLYEVTRERAKSKKDGHYLKTWKITDKKFITDDPDEIVRRIYDDPNMDSNQILTTRDAYDALIDSSMWENDEIRHEIERCFREEMNRHKGNYNAPSWIKF